MEIVRPGAQAMIAGGVGAAGTDGAVAYKAGGSGNKEGNSSLMEEEQERVTLPLFGRLRLSPPSYFTFNEDEEGFQQVPLLTR